MIILPLFGYASSPSTSPLIGRASNLSGSFNVEVWYVVDSCVPPECLEETNTNMQSAVTVVCSDGGLQWRQPARLSQKTSSRCGTF